MFEVAFICTGNRARSPFAMEVFRRHAGDLPVAVRSFGILDLGHVPALPKARRAARRHGVDLSSHRAQSLSAGDLAGSGLAVGFEPMHVASAVVVGGIARERAFLLTELTDLLDGIPADETAGVSPERLVELVHTARLQHPRTPVTIADPVGGSDHDFATTFERIARHVVTLAVRFAGAASREGESPRLRPRDP